LNKALFRNTTQTLLLVRPLGSVYSVLSKHNMHSIPE
jgi:hypothetical protein